MTGRLFARVALAAVLPALPAFRAAAAPLFPAPPEDADVFGPMRAELDRSVKRLKLDSFGPPYFLAYRYLDAESLSVAASFGAVTSFEREAGGRAYVEARFGDEAFDNTDFQYHGRSGSAPVEPGGLRQALWSLTDSVYKAAVAGYLDRKARRATELDRDNLPDFTREPSYVASSPNRPLDAAAAELRALAASVSAEFRKAPHLQGGSAHVSVRRSRRYLLTSEGTRIASPAGNTAAWFMVSAWGRADDGMLVDTQRSWVAATPAGLPETEVLRREARRVSDEVAALRKAPLQEPLAAPALFDPEFTGVLFHEALGHKLEGPAQRDPAKSHLFRDRVGSRIIPEFLSVVDDPTMAEFGGQALNGHYRYDDEGVPAQEVTLVDRGVLKAFLLSRWPVKGFDRSNGHGRAAADRHPSGRMANLMVVAHETLPPSGLKARLRELAAAQGKPYGFWLRGSHGGENPSNRASAQTLEVRPRLVYRVDAATGEELLVRGVKLVGTPLVILNRIVAAGDDAALANAFHCGSESGSIPVNQIAPSVLVGEAELQRLPEERARPPILPPPLHDKP